MKRKEKERKKKEKKEKKNPCVGKKEKEKIKEKGESALYDSRCFDGKKLLVRELKLIYSMRAMSRCQKQKGVV